MFQLSTPPQLTGAPFFVAAPLMAAPLYTWWATLAFGVAGLLSAVLLQLAAGAMWGRAAVHDLATELATIVFVTAVAILLNRVVRRGQARLSAARGRPRRPSEPSCPFRPSAWTACTWPVITRRP
ncbi:Integral membrane protein [Streptomyces venezuelae]|nr:Integral membrane protein [Streptomyces venezuelae]CUM43842.1 Serine phosphatase RsbU, regulator of sigma subunit [Streptomyces venezuelae]